jgi:DNA N-6-adenine-methyltransferase (Dam)
MTDQSPASPSLRAAASGTSAELTLDDARKLYEKFADKDGGDAVRVMAQIALWGKRQQIEGGRLRLLALRQLGRFLIRNGRAQGRPATPPSAVQIAEAAKTSSADVLPTLASLGIADRHISADAKSVARISQKDFDAYLADESEPTLKGLLRFGDHARNGRPDPIPSFNTHAVPLAMEGRSRWQGLLPKAGELLDPNEIPSHTEWYTPPEFFNSMGVEFDLDPCSPGKQIVPWNPARRHLIEKDDGLATDWGNAFCWMNPPYGLRWNVDEWIEKFVAHRNGVALLPDFTSTGWWHLLTANANVVMFVKPKI